MADNGLVLDHRAVSNLYVALKTCPFVVLAGPVGTGKITAVVCLAEALGCNGTAQRQRMVGHAWWAQGCKSITLLTEAQATFNAQKFLALLEEARRVENVDIVHMAIVTRISPAELQTLFEPLSYQARHASIMRVPPIHLEVPIDYPDNLFLIGTLDHPPLEAVFPDDLWQGVLVIPWEAEMADPHHTGRQNGRAKRQLPYGRVFLGARLREKGSRRARLYRTVRDEPTTLQPLVRLAALLRNHVGSPGQAGLRRALRYLASAWARDGEGLFDLRTQENLRLALDYAILQALLIPAASSGGRGGSWVPQARRILGEQFPSASAFLQAAA